MPAPGRIGPYCPERALGEGGGGIVYLAHRDRDRTAVALKTIHAVAPERIDLLRREIRAISRVRHPDVVQVYEDGVCDGLPWYSMQYLDMPTLSAWIAELWSQSRLPQAQACSETVKLDGGSGIVARDVCGPPAVEEVRVDSRVSVPPSGIRRRAAGGRLADALTVVVALCRPLAFVHGEGIVHRDLKPSNIFVPRSNRTIIADFGLATDFEGADGRGSVDFETSIRGSVAYMAPEQIQMQAVDARADLYSVGCILYELLTGAPPFGVGFSHILSAHIHDMPPPPSTLIDGVPQALDDVVMRLLAKEPARRIGYAEVLARLLRDLGAEPPEPLEAPPPRPYLYRPRFVGRRPELRKLQQALHETLSQTQQRLVLVVGESGIGKSRVVAELGVEAQRLGVPVVASESRSNISVREQGSAHAATGDTPLGGLRPFLQMVAERCHREGHAYTASLLGHQGQLLLGVEPTFQFLPGLETQPPLPTLPVALAQRRFFTFLSHLLCAFSDHSGMLMILDDLQWADQLSLALLQYLVSPEAPRMPLLLVATCRAEERSPAIDQLAQRATVIAMQRLDDREVHSLVKDMLAADEATDKLAQFLARQSEGNPYFVGEYLRTAVTCRMLELGDNGAWCVSTHERHQSLGDSWNLPLPNGLREILELRLRELDSPGQRLLSAAAVLGRTFKLEVCRRVAGLSEEEGLEAEQELIAHQVIGWTAKGALRFDHDKIREIRYGQLAPEERRRLHRDAAQVLESVSPSPLTLTADAGTTADLFAQLGHHWSAAGDPERGADYLRRAGDAARAVPAMQEAARYYRAALEQLTSMREGIVAHAPVTTGVTGDGHVLTARDATLHESLGDVLERDGHHDAARSSYAAAAARLSADARVDRARLLRKQGLAWEVVHDHTAELQALDEAAELLEHPECARTESWAQEWLEIHVRRAVVFYFQDEIAKMNGVIEAIEPTVLERGNARQRAMLYHLASNAKNRGNRFVASDEVVELARNAVAAIELTDDLLEKVNLRFDLGFALLWRGRIDEAVVALRDSLELARTTGDLLLICRCLVYLGVAVRRQGDLEPLASLAEEAMKAATAGGFADYVACAHAHAGWLCLRRGDRDLARAHVQAAATSWRDLAKSYPFPFQWLALLPQLDISLSDDDLAECRQLARELLHATQLQLPARLEEALRAIIAVPDTDDSPASLRLAVERGLDSARQHGYL